VAPTASFWEPPSFDVLRNTATVDGEVVAGPEDVIDLAALQSAVAGRLRYQQLDRGGATTCRSSPKLSDFPERIGRGQPPRFRLEFLALWQRSTRHHQECARLVSRKAT